MNFNVIHNTDGQRKIPHSSSFPTRICCEAKSGGSVHFSQFEVKGTFVLFRNICSESTTPQGA